MRNLNCRIIPGDELTKDEHDLLVSVSAKINAVLIVPGIHLALFTDCADDYLGDHDCVNQSININKQLCDAVIEKNTLIKIIVLKLLILLLGFLDLQGLLHMKLCITIKANTLLKRLNKTF